MMITADAGQLAPADELPEADGVGEADEVRDADDIDVMDDDISVVMLALMRQLSVTKHRLAANHLGEPLPLQLLIKVGEGEPRRAGDLAVEMSADPSTISRQVALLVRAGLVERRADPQDGRACNLVLTDAGRARRRQVSHDIGDLFDTIIRDWSDGERTEFIRLLSRYVDGLTVHRDEFVDRVAASLHLSV